MERSSHLETLSALLALVEPSSIELCRFVSFCRLPPRLSVSLFSDNGEESLQEYYPVTSTKLLEAPRIWMRYKLRDS